jgi:sugar phosphate isomerase/epimerase
MRTRRDEAVKLSCQEHIVPGESFAERLAFLNDLGFEGIELTLGDRGIMEGSLRHRVEEIRSALADSPVRVSAVCTKVYDLLDCNPEARKAAMAQVVDGLEVAAAVGAVGNIIVPRFGAPVLPDLSPVFAPRQLEQLLIVAMLKELASRAEELGVLIMMEPLHRYIAKFLRTVDHGIQICQEVGSPNVRIMIDTFQSLQDEVWVPDSIRRAGPFVHHIHLSDNNRRLPGFGSTDFRAIFAALRDINYGNYMSYECEVPGDKAAELRAAADFTKRALEESKEVARV